MKRALIILAIAVVATVLVVLGCHLRNRPPSTIAERLEQFGATARARLKPRFDEAGLSYPPQKLTLVGFKAERLLQIYATNVTGVWKFIHADRKSTRLNSSHVAL